MNRPGDRSTRKAARPLIAGVISAGHTPRSVGPVEVAMWDNGLAVSRFEELEPRERGRAAVSGVFHVQCHCCGYEPPMGRAPRRCPKCGSGAWERYIVPGSLLVAALHRRPEALNFGRVCSTCQPPVWTRFMRLTETLRDRGRMLLEDEDVSSNPDRGG